jgi:hypothetical protein
MISAAVEIVKIGRQAVASQHSRAGMEHEPQPKHEVTLTGVLYADEKNRSKMWLNVHAHDLNL